ncbi:hypothetical protein C9374_011169 [Naegleria lovaniensis]|uniref:Uncharacterized protein n=1 Tax=Naegleria lovaniensis TaxID=51637 RepID=A0AA88KCR3_NAELO|nr:uncharacterized protein C9374_011169 [Naegleria lovaniensis]KAG2374090.1 hypothetical protein C9374_011169 [Naegleria lovaniensis]
MLKNSKSKSSNYSAISDKSQLQYDANSKRILKRLMRELLLTKNVAPSTVTNKKDSPLKNYFKDFPMDVLVGNVFQFISYFELIHNFAMVSKEWFFSVWEKYLFNSSISRLFLNFEKSLKRSFHFAKLGGEYTKFPILLPSYDDHVMCDSNFGNVKLEPVALFGENCEAKLHNLQESSRQLKFLPLDPLQEYRVLHSAKFSIDQDSDIVSRELHHLEHFRKYVTGPIRGAYRLYKTSPKRVPLNKFSFAEIFFESLYSNKEHVAHIFFPSFLKKEIKNLNVSEKDQNKAYFACMVWLMREILSFFYMIFQYRMYSTKYSNKSSAQCSSSVNSTTIMNTTNRSSSSGNDNNSNTISTKNNKYQQVEEETFESTPSNIKICLREKRVCLSRYEGHDHFSSHVDECFAQVADVLYGMNVMNANSGLTIGFIGWRVLKTDVTFKKRV